MWVSASPLTPIITTSRGGFFGSGMTTFRHGVRLRAKKSNVEQDIDLSVFRFTLGIPGFDDSQLPRVLGYLFGGLILLNHVFSGPFITVAQLRSEAAGLLLSSFAISLPYLKEEMDGKTARLASFPPEMKQILAMAESLTEKQKQEVAWASIALIRNTRTIAVMIFSGEEIVLARGCWNIPPAESLKYMQEMLAESPFSSATTSIYLSSGADNQGIKLVPKAAKSLFFQPFAFGAKTGGIIVISDIPRAYRAKDRTWIELIANKLTTLL